MFATVPPRLRQSLAALQRRIEDLYGLEPGPDVGGFVRLDEDCAYEQVLVGQGEGSVVELLVVLPADIDPDAPEASDGGLQLIEGTSHFVHLAERARTDLPTTQLELELQAEVDKFALLAESAQGASLHGLHRWLFERVSYLHASDTVLGQRYRFANHLAARLWARLVERDDASFTRELLWRFYRLGQTDKLNLIAAV